MKKRKFEKHGILEIPKIKKRRFLKTLVALSFFVGGTLIYGKLTEEKQLPYKDKQEMPEENNSGNNDIIEQLELQIALDAYDHLLSQIYLKSARLGVPLTDEFLIKIISYDNMTDSIEVVLQNQNKTAVLKFDANNLDDIQLHDNMKLSDQVSQLAILLDSPLLEVPYIHNFNQKINNHLNDFVASGIRYYASTTQQFSDGNLRNELMDEALLAGRDYVFFNVYGKGFKEGVEYDVISIVSMQQDNFDILGRQDIVEYYLENPEDPKFEVNVFYQENQKTLMKLNDQKTKNLSPEK